MIITVAFDVKNYVEVMEGWPIRTEDMTFFLEREGTVLKRVCLAFSGVEIAHAPSLSRTGGEGGRAHLKIGDGGYAARARDRIMNWQAVVSGLQVVDLDFDSYELRFSPEGVNEEPHIHVSSFRPHSDRALNSACDFEQLGRAFCVGQILDDRIESTAHFREGRIAYEAGRYVDAYNNMFLFLETRYCDGKTKTAQQIQLLSSEARFCESLERTAKEFREPSEISQRRRFDLFEPADSTRDKIKTLVLLRGNLRHHSLKSPHRWDPNRQDEHESAARFLGCVVGDIVIRESLADIYTPDALAMFRDISISSGHETKIELMTHRLERERTLSLDMSYPSTVISSQLCLVAVRHAMQACEKEGQLADTVKFEAVNGEARIELLSLDLGVWAYTEARAIEADVPIGSVRCSFEHFRSGTISKHDFSIPFQNHRLTIHDAWNLLRSSLDHIERRDPTTRIMNLKLFLKDNRKAILTYRVGAQVRN